MKEQKQQNSTKPIKLVFLAVALFATGAFNSRGQVTASIAQQAYIKASNTGGPTPGDPFLDYGYGDAFGHSVAISGDTMVIGALGEDSNATGVNGKQTNNSALNSGAAYVFVRDGTNWVQQAYLKASNTGAGDEFGRSVAISGDTVVVGAWNEDSNATGVNANQTNNSATDSGAAYVFVREGTNWSQQAYLKASNTGAGDSFGYSVAVFGDTVVVGAPNEDSNATGVNGNQGNNSATDSGAAYVFVRNGTTWSQQAYLKASITGGPSPGETRGDAFGIAVAVFGDTIAIGAGEEDSNADGINGNQSDNSAPSSGAVYVFVRNGTNWSQQAYLKASNSDPEDDFGYAVALSDNTLVVGAHKEASKASGVNGNQSDNSAMQAGAAYVFVRDGTNWSQQAYLKASNPDGLDPRWANGENGDVFGISVAILADTVIVGAANEASNATGVNGDQSDDSAPGAGAAYVFVRSGTNWSQQAYLKSSNTRTSGGFFTTMFGGIPDSAQGFGISVAISGDTVVVGKDGEFSNATGVNGDQSNTNAPFSGAAYVFTGVGAPAVPPTQFTYFTNDGTITITGYTGTNGVVIIPDRITGLSVTAIGDWAFSGTNATSVIIPDSVTNIGVSAFDSSLVTNVTIPNSVTSIGESAFWDCRSLTSVNIPNKVTSIGYSVFRYCHNLTSITIPNSVTNIGTAAFDGCGLTNVTIPNSVTSIDVWAFKVNTSLTRVAIGDSVISIGNGAFEFCTSLTSVTIPNSVTSILDGAFGGDISLTNVAIGNGVTNIGAQVFGGCTSLTAINVESNHPAYSSVSGVLFDKNQTTLIQYPAGKVGSYSIPNSVTSIGDGAFWGCTSLTDVTIPNSVTSIGANAFYGCTNLTEVYFQGNAPSAPLSGFFDGHNATAYYLPGTTGWHSTYGGIPTALWLPQVHVTDSSFGAKTNQFGFKIVWADGLSVVVEASPSLSNPVWSPVQTNVLNNGVVNFADPEWNKNPSRFYRVRSQ